MKTADVIKACVEAGEPDLAAHFIAQGTTPKRLRARLEEVAEIRALARRAIGVQPPIASSFGDELIAAGVDVDETKDIIAHKLVEMQSPEIINVLPIADAPKDHGWGDVIDKTTPSRLRPHLKGS